MRQFCSKLLTLLRRYSLVFVAGFIFAVLCFVGLEAAMKPVSKSEYCGSTCHEMGTAYKSWELSVHGTNKHGIGVGCVDCHLPSKDKYFTYIAAKAYAGGKDAYKHYFGGEYDIEKMREKVVDHITNERCLSCHDNLLVRPSGPAARIAHTASLARPDAPETKCVRCHENVGHQRQNKLFSP